MRLNPALQCSCPAKSIRHCILSIDKNNNAGGELAHRVLPLSQTFKKLKHSQEKWLYFEGLLKKIK